jgi:hypothetical protein
LSLPMARSFRVPCEGRVAVEHADKSFRRFGPAGVSYKPILSGPSYRETISPLTAGEERKLVWPESRFE